MFILGGEFVRNRSIYLTTFIIFFCIGLFIAAWLNPVTRQVIVDLVPEFAGSENQMRPTGELRVHVIDVGQGDAILVQAPTGETMLIDGGERSKEVETKLLGYLRAQGVKQINVMVATHPHSDHIGGLSAVLRELPVGLVCDSGKVSTSNTYRTFIDLIDKKKIPYYLARRGNFIHLASGVDVEILNPTNNVDKVEMNNASVVLRVTYYKVSFLLTGDAETDVEMELVKEGAKLGAQVLKVGHHGSNTSTSTTFLGRVNPQYALVSVGEDNSYGHPAASTMKKLEGRGVRTYLTKDHGDIVVTTNGETIEVKTGRR